MNARTIVEQPKPLLISVPDAAVRLGIGRSLAWDLVQKGTLPSTKIGGRVLIHCQTIEMMAARALAGLIPEAPKPVRRAAKR